MRITSSLSVLTSCVLLLIGCNSGQSNDEGAEKITLPRLQGDSASYDDDESDFDPEIEALAEDYLFADIDEAESLDVQGRLLSLDLDDQRKFREAVLALQPDDPSTEEDDEAVELIREIHEAAIAEGVNIFELDRSEFERFVADTYGIELVGDSDSEPDSDDDSTSESPDGAPMACLPGYASCSTSSFPYTVADGHACPASYVAPSASDRVSNSSCELLACDYRLRYTTSSRKSSVYGATTAAQCVLDYYGGSLISSKSSSYQYVLSGVGGPSKCLITTGSSAWAYLYIY